MFSTVLVANRGEIACRVIRTLDRLGIRSVAVYSDADADAPHVRLANVAVRIGTAAAADSYLDIDAVIAAARATGAEAVHPGYGFLSENAAFAGACAAAGIVFIGPSPEALAAMGDKIRARAHVSARGVPVVPGLARAGLTDEELLAAMPGIGFPALIKPSAGGGGKGMHVVERLEDAPAALAAARREAAGAFGDDTLFVERYVATPRHIEVQVVADAHGAVVAFGERECSLQRRHQKVVEEAPSVLLDEPTRLRICADACETARSVGYTGAGTVEFIVSADAPDEYFFLEMNTRLQVEHPVTELVSGVDLVELQLQVAAGQPLGVRQEDVRLTGHAIEARLYAEDPAAGFLPTGGTLLAVALPGGEGVRVDGAIATGMIVTSDYDPMLAKIIAWAPDRAQAIARLRRALGETVVQGVGTNVAFLAALLDDPDVRAGDLDTGLIERRLAALTAGSSLPHAAVRAALITHATERRDGGGPWQRLGGWRLTGPAPARFAFRHLDGGAPETVLVTGSPQATVVRTEDGALRPASVVLEEGIARIRLDGVESRTHWIRAGEVLHLAADGRTAVLTERPAAIDGRTAGAADPELRSPMPGTVVAVPAADGTVVADGDPVVVVEAMKMEYAVRATTAGRVTQAVSVGDRVGRGQVLAVIEAETEASG
ncbi:biotin carboxylase N-terminal domain-containing protein [Amnibacterium sp.]|uniref:acetyl/propionyl/methylcrotonyl-CoA carboxylase subunit alpha n=1 Tax=Amnibacterium sp. TaxID=1872496 RepID=UPI002628F15B|nr:biotin carboxylase N-terminal domain-containing protein [Amnibacterium sp.]